MNKWSKASDEKSNEGVILTCCMCEGRGLVKNGCRLQVTIELGFEDEGL